MPRLFVSHRQQPLTAAPTMKMIPTVPTPSPPPSIPIQHRPVIPAATPMTSDEGLPVVLVPPVPPALGLMMDSHDLDNPYLVASFNVLIENHNNPMRVPDILQAVQRKGWTQVLHRHKDRPEQLFGNALRSHQRRREQIGKPSLVFMIDAGSCWKRHQIDLSAASGRKKGKIWCFSVDAGYPCPYARLGFDLSTIIKSQGGTDGGNDDGEGDENIRPSIKSTSAKTEVPVKKRRKLEDPLHEAVRGVAPSTQHNVVLPPSREPAATIEAASARAVLPYGTRSSRTGQLSSAGSSKNPATVRGRRPVVVEVDDDIDLEALTAMSPEPDSMQLDGVEDIDLVEIPADIEEFHYELPTTAAQDLESIPIVDISLINDLVAESDDDDDDFHVTMREFSIAPAPVATINCEDFSELLNIPALEENETSSSGESIIRTPTPPTEDTASYVTAPTPGDFNTDITNWSIQASSGSAHSFHQSDAPFHSVGLGFTFDDGGWDTVSSGIQVKIEPEDQGWSRAGSPFVNQFQDLPGIHDHREVDSPMSSHSIDPLDNSVPGTPQEESHPFPFAHLQHRLHPDNLSIGSRASSVSRQGSLLSRQVLSRQSSICSMRSSRSSIIKALVAVQIPADEPAPPESRRMSLAPASAPSSRPHSPHPFILYSPSVSASPVDADRPFRAGLAQRYLVDVQTEEVDVPEVDPEEEKELEGLLNLDADDDVDELPLPAPMDIPSPSSSARLKRRRSPSP